MKAVIAYAIFNPQGRMHDSYTSLTRKASIRAVCYTFSDCWDQLKAKGWKCKKVLIKKP